MAHQMADLQTGNAANRIRELQQQNAAMKQELDAKNQRIAQLETAMANAGAQQQQQQQQAVVQQQVGCLRVGVGGCVSQTCILALFFTFNLWLVYIRLLPTRQPHPEHQLAS